MRQDTFNDNSRIRLTKASLSAQLKRRYRNLFVNVFRFDGFDYDVPRWLMNKMFDGVPLAAIRLNTNAEITQIGFTPFTEVGYDLYSRPVKVRLLNQWNSNLVPTKELTNGVDAVLLKPDFVYSEIVDSYVQKLVNIEMTQRTNLLLHKMPFVVTNPAMEQAIQDVLDDKEVIAVAATVADNAKSMQTNTPYIIDKLQSYKLDIENELLNILGIKSIKHEKAAQMNVDETNMAEQESSCYQDILFDKLTDWITETNAIFGTSFAVRINENFEPDEENPNPGTQIEPEPKKEEDKQNV